MPMTKTIPAFPVRDIVAAVAFYETRFGFVSRHTDTDFAIVVRDEAVLHLWASSDESWRSREDIATNPVCSGAESFIAGTHSCRIQCDAIDELYAELRAADVLHPTDGGAPEDTDWGTREFATIDLEGNLLTFFRR